MSGTEYNYDNEGQFFPYFVLTIVSLITIPTTYSVLKPSKELENSAPRIESEYKPEHADLIEGQKRKQKRKEFKLKRMLFSTGGWLIMAYMVYLIIVTARTIPKIWDPYDVLGVARSASEKQIKSHYRRLSLTLHPDKVKIDPLKNQTIETVNEYWVEVTKAFKALTDEEIRNNYLQYGHPDGKQSFSMGIALPKWIVEEGYGKYTLAFYLALLGVFLPWLVGRWWYGTQKTTKDGVLVNTAGTLFREYKEDVDTGKVIGILSGGDEYKEILTGTKATSGIDTIEKKISEGLTQGSLEKLQGMDDKVRRKALGLLWAYLGRVELKDATLDDEKYEVAPTAFALNEAFLVMALSYGNMQPLLSCFRASQSLIQALPPGSSPLLQLPYITHEIASKIQGESTRDQMTVQEFMALTPAIRKERSVGAGLLTAEQLREAERIASQLPHLQIAKAFFKVQGEKFVTPNSIVQLVIKARIIPPGSSNIPEPTEKDLLERDLPDNQATEEEAKRITPPLAHAPYFARDHSPRWHVFLGDSKQNRVAVPPFTFATFDKPPFTEDGKPTYNIQTLKMQFGAPPQPGHYTFVMHLLCDSYVGMDLKTNITLVVEDGSKADGIIEEDEISEPDEDSLAGQIKAAKEGKLLSKDDDDSSDGSNTEGEEVDDDTSETDTDTDEE